MDKVTIGFALTGSFCTFSQVIPIVRKLVEKGYRVIPIMSEFSYETDTRFGKAADFATQLEMYTDHSVLHTIVEAEPIGPNALLDLLVVAPCTGNTLGKLAAGITDSCVTMAVKSHLRNQRPVLLAVSSNDALSGSSKNIGALLNYKNVYFVPMQQDNPAEKPRSLVADFPLIPQAIEEALHHKQIQPIYLL